MEIINLICKIVIWILMLLLLLLLLLLVLNLLGLYAVCDESNVHAFASRIFSQCSSINYSLTKSYKQVLHSVSCISLAKHIIELLHLCLLSFFAFCTFTMRSQSQCITIRCFAVFFSSIFVYTVFFFHYFFSLG